MNRWIHLSTRASMGLLALLLLAGCASNRAYYYDDGYYASRGSTYSGSYGDSYRSSYGGYYAGGGGYGDYHYGEVRYDYPGYFAWPAYYSVFWPLNRWYHDPFWYPGYYYGVTYFPRNYFSFSVGWSSGWPRYSYFAYSPYRYAWHDTYYDWYPWYRHSHHHRGYLGRPRFGDARNEAERLARLSAASRRSAAAYALAPADANQRFDGRGRWAAPEARGGARAALPVRGRSDVGGAQPRGRGGFDGPRQRDSEPAFTPRPRARSSDAVRGGASAMRARSDTALPQREVLPRGATAREPVQRGYAYGERPQRATSSRGIVADDAYAGDRGYPVRRASVRDAEYTAPARGRGGEAGRFDGERRVYLPEAADLPRGRAPAGGYAGAGYAPAPRSAPLATPAAMPSAPSPVRAAPAPVPQGSYDRSPERSHERSAPAPRSFDAAPAPRESARSGRRGRHEP